MSIRKSLINLLTGLLIRDPWARRQVRAILRTSAEMRNRKLWLADSAPSFSVIHAEKPLVSIIVPAYNHFKYTSLCLWSILNNTKGIDYEVIIADDASTDATSDIGKRIPNVIHSRHQRKMGFLHNCNSAAKKARGKYILFLDNDTQVQPDWLPELLKTAENDEKIGIVGPMLVYPDRTVRSAGCIVLSDGNVIEYGRGKLPEASCVSYRKDVDSISEVCLMIRHELWEKIGGFDEQFAPLYYEDVDLAFAVRAEGMRVVYVPSSVVVHFDRISSDSDLSYEEKNDQAINREKFCNKWKEVLMTEQATSSDLFTARDRSAGKKVLLFVDDQILTPDRDCGSRASFTYLRFFADCGFNVKFMPRLQHMTSEKWRYASDIGEMGVELIMESHVEWLRANGRYLDYVYLNRPGPAIELLPLLKRYTCARILYQGHDLHHWRMEREYKLHPNPELAAKAKEMRNIESAIFSEVNCSFMFSDVEVKKIKGMLPHVNADSVPLFVMNVEMMDHFTYKAEEREGLMFVAGFGHPPNADGILWFINEVWPLVLAKYPSVVLSIAGSSMPKSVSDLASQNVRILGCISDEELHNLYSRARLSIVPLRYGAGVKGKVVEALYHKIPVVTTSIGAEGIPETPLVTVGDTAELFATRLVELYQNTGELNARSSAAKEFIGHYFAKETVLRKFSPWIEFPNRNIGAK